MKLICRIDYERHYKVDRPDVTDSEYEDQHHHLQQSYLFLG